MFTGVCRVFRVTASLVRVTVSGGVSIVQVPAFVLEANVHGLRDERDAVRFAEAMLRDLADPAVVTADAVRIAVPA